MYWSHKPRGVCSLERHEHQDSASGHVWQCVKGYSQVALGWSVLEEGVDCSYHWPANVLAEHRRRMYHNVPHITIEFAAFVRLDTVAT